MNRVTRMALMLVVGTVSSLAIAQPQPGGQPSSTPAPANQPQGGNPDAAPKGAQQTAEWMQSLRVDALKIIQAGDQARKEGKDDVALSKYMRARETYKSVLSAEEIVKLSTDIHDLRIILNLPDPDAPVPAKIPDLSDPAKAARRTDGLRMLSEAEQYLEEGNFQKSLEMMTKIYNQYRDVFMPEEAKRAEEGLRTVRDRLGLPAVAPGSDEVAPIVVRTGDEELDAVCQLFNGSFATSGKSSTDDVPAVSWRGATVNVGGLTNAVYFEVARVDDPAHPFRQGVLTLYRSGKELRLRVLDIPSTGLRAAVTGMWAAPDAFPQVTVEDLAANADLIMTRAENGSGYSAKTKGKLPTVKGGAVEMTSSLGISADGITIDDVGFDANGTQVWRSGDEGGLVFQHAPRPKTVTRKENGLIILDLVAGDSSGQKLGKGGEIALHYTEWLTDGTKIDSSRGNPRGAVRVRYPIGQLKGLDEGLDEIPVGCVRRLIIPAELGWGAQGRGTIPPNATLIFEIECMWVQAPQTPPEIPGQGEEGPVAPQAAPVPKGGGH